MPGVGSLAGVGSSPARPAATALDLANAALAAPRVVSASSPSAGHPVTGGAATTAGAFSPADLDGSLSPILRSLDVVGSALAAVVGEASSAGLPAPAGVLVPPGSPAAQSGLLDALVAVSARLSAPGGSPSLVLEVAGRTVAIPLPSADADASALAAFLRDYLVSTPLLRGLGLVSVASASPVVGAPAVGQVPSGAPGSAPPAAGPALPAGFAAVLHAGSSEGALPLPSGSTALLAALEIPALWVVPAEALPEDFSLLAGLREAFVTRSVSLGLLSGLLAASWGVVVGSGGLPAHGSPIAPALAPSPGLAVVLTPGFPVLDGAPPGASAAGLPASGPARSEGGAPAQSAAAILALAAAVALDGSPVPARAVLADLYRSLDPRTVFLLTQGLLPSPSAVPAPVERRSARRRRSLGQLLYGGRPPREETD